MDFVHKSIPYRTAIAHCNSFTRRDVSKMASARDLFRAVTVTFFDSTRTPASYTVTCTSTKCSDVSSACSTHQACTTDLRTSVLESAMGPSNNTYVDSHQLHIVCEAENLPDFRKGSLQSPRNHRDLCQKIRVVLRVARSTETPSPSKRSGAPWCMESEYTFCISAMYTQS